MNAAAANGKLPGATIKTETTVMFAILAVIAFVVAAIIVVSILGAALHFLFSPLVLVAIIAVLAWMKFGPRRSRQ